MNRFSILNNIDSDIVQTNNNICDNKHANENLSHPVNSNNCINLTNLRLSKKTFNLGHLNSQGLTNKIDQIKIMLNSPLNKIDFFGISETKFNNDHKTEYFHIDGYQPPFRKDRLENKGGGILCYVKNGINCIRRIDIEDINIECVWVEIKPKNAKSFLVGSIYRHPDSKIIWRDFFESHIEKVQLEDKEIILLGDMNRDLLNTRINTEWTEFTNSLGLTQLVKTPTRISANSKTLIDHIYTDDEENIVNVNVPALV